MAVVVITGCSSGIGMLLALAFARNGDCVYATMRDLSKAADLQAAAARQDLSLRLAQLDVTDGASVERAVAQVLAATGRIDVVVNNAGVGRSGAVELLPDAMLRETFETNLFGPIRVIRAVLPGMRQRRSGCIVNVSSLAGRLWGKPVTSAYDASKHALGTLSDGLALEVERFGIRVRVIEPGFFATRMLHNSAHVGGACSPYERVEDAVLGFFERIMASAPDAQPVADAIVAAAHAPDPWPIHLLVGQDAEALVADFHSMSEQDWAARAKASLGL